MSMPAGVRVGMDAAAVPMCRLHGHWRTVPRGRTPERLRMVKFALVGKHVAAGHLQERVRLTQAFQLKRLLGT